MNYWWVNQNKTFRRAVDAGFLWSPKTKSNGKPNPFYDTMTQVQPGDIVFAFSDTFIKGIAIVTGPHESRERPAGYKDADNAWGNDGWHVPVSYTILESGVRVRDHMDQLAPLLPDKYSPLKPNGNANEVYLCAVPEAMANALLGLISAGGEKIDELERLLADQKQLDAIVKSKSLPETEKMRLVQARIGQGVFRANVMLIEPECRVTGISDPRFLVASHIRPWAISDNEARLDGNNGLMLAPHIDRLFDRGFITFSDDGKLMVSSHLPDDVRERWSLLSTVAERPFSKKQRAYLKDHRQDQFKG